MSEDHNSQVYMQKTPRFSKLQTTVLIFSIILVVLIVPFALLLWSGYATVVRKTSDQSILVVSTRCDDALINRYNTAYNQDSLEAMRAGLKTISEDIAKIQNPQDDPNCVFMTYSNALETKDLTTAESSVAQLEALAGKGYYATTQLTNVRSTETLKQEIKAAREAPAYQAPVLNPDEQPENPDGRG